MRKPKPSQSTTEPGETDLPEGWASAIIADITVPKVDQSGPGESNEFTYIDIASIDNDEKRVTAPRIVSKRDAPSRARQVVRSGDVLVSMTRPNLNAVALVDPNLNGAIASTGFDVLRPVEVTPGWLFLIVRGQTFIDSMTALVQGALYPAVRPHDVRSFALPIPPFAEQRRIVTKAEALLQRTDAARERLAKLPVILKRLRESVLAAACSGQLTAEWRALHSVQAVQNGESADTLKSEVRRKRVLSPSTEPTGELPPSWEWKSIDELLETGRSVGYGFVKPGPHDPGGVRVLKSGSINHRRVSTAEDTRISSRLDEQYRRTRLQGGEVLLNLVGASIGRSAVAPPEVRGWNVSRAIAVVPVRKEIAQWVHLAIEGPAGQGLIRSKSGGSAQPVLNIEEVRSLGMPVPPAPEVSEIVRRVEALLTLADEIERHVRTATVRAEHLPQAILAKAFKGELVPTEAQVAADEGRDYEPASVLLERINESRKQNKPAKRGRGGMNMAKRSSRQPTKIRKSLDEVLREQGKPLTPERLFDLAGFDEGSVDGFYERSGN